MAGFFEGDYRINIQHRSQWSSISVPFTSTSFSLDSKWKKIGFGIQLLLDESGTSRLKQNQINIAVAYEFKNWRIGSQFGFAQRSINYEELLFSNNLDENLSIQKKNHFDISLGLHRIINLADDKILQLGLSSFHLNKPNQSFTDHKDLLFIRTLVYSKMKIPLSEYWELTPMLILNKQSVYKEIVLGSVAKFDITEFYFKEIELELGLMYRWKDATSVSLGAHFENSFISLSYDWNISELIPASNGMGAWELSFTHIIKNKITKYPEHKVCPIYL